MVSAIFILFVFVLVVVIVLKNRNEIKKDIIISFTKFTLRARANVGHRDLSLLGARELDEVTFRCICLAVLAAHSIVVALAVNGLAHTFGRIIFHNAIGARIVAGDARAELVHLFLVIDARYAAVTS